MAASAWRRYDTLPLYMGQGYIDFDGDELMCALFLSTSNAATLTNTVNEYGDLTNEHANGNGYLTGGVQLTNVTWTQSTSTCTFDCDDVSWTAAGGSIVARFAVIYSRRTIAAPTGTITKPVICYSLLDTTPADVTVTTGNSLTLQINASGVLTITGGQT